MQVLKNTISKLNSKHKMTLSIMLQRTQDKTIRDWNGQN